MFHSMRGQCAWYEGRKGITCDRNGIYFVPIIEQGANNFVKIRSRPDAGRIDIGPVKTAWVESDMLYPLIKGAGDFETCYIPLDSDHYVADRLYTFVPNKGISNADYRECDIQLNSPHFEKTRSWFAGFRPTLEARSTYRRQMNGAPYQAVYNVGAYTFAPWKVIWPEMSNRFYAAVCGSQYVPGIGLRPYVPDHKIYFVAFQDRLPADFLCGLLNTPSVREWIESHNITIQVGNIFKHMTLPQFDAENPDHQYLARVVKMAHAEHDAPARQILVSEASSVGERLLERWRTQ